MSDVLAGELDQSHLAWDSGLIASRRRVVMAITVAGVDDTHHAVSVDGRDSDQLYSSKGGGIDQAM